MDSPLPLSILGFFLIMLSKILGIIILLHPNYLRRSADVTHLKKENKATVKKRIAVSKKRQITIPIDFYNSVGIDKEVECYVQNNSIVIRPVQESSGEFDEQILADLISQGLTGQELLDKFKETRRQIRPAVERLQDDARLAAQGQAPSSNYEDVFAPEEE